MAAAAVAVAAGPGGVALADLVGFAARARALPAAGWADPNHPVGYPLLLRAGALALGDVLAAAHGINAVAFGAVVALGARWGGLPGAALLAAAAVPALRVAGTDLPAAAAGLGAVHAAAGRRPGAAGLAWGLALAIRYQSAILAPVLVGLAGWRAPRLLGAAAVVVAPGLLGAALEGRWPGPDPSWNLALAHGADGPSAGSVGAGFGRALADLAGLRANGGGGLALALALGVAAGWRRGRRSRALLGWALLHLGVLGVFFSNERLVLPARLAVLGAAAGGGGAVATLAAVAVAPTAAGARGAPGALEAVAAALPPGPVWATDPRVHGRDGPWLRPARPWSALGPAVLRGPGSLVWAAEAEGAALVLDASRVHGQYPAFGPLFEGPAPAGWVDRPAPAGWRVLVPVGAPAGGSGGALRGGGSPPAP
jgi:hypothetical protein